MQQHCSDQAGRRRHMHSASRSVRVALASPMRRRCMQVRLLGTLTRTEERRMTEAMHSAARCPSNPVQAERALMAEAGKNPYQQALLLIRMAPFQADQHAQVRA
jgi:hypothetical protein